MATLVFFHAHPDDEAIATGGTMALAARAGHRVILVLATRGEVGEPVDGVLGDGEALGDRRTVETMVAAEMLAVERVAFLGYEDSGMMGEPTNDNPACFWQADEHEAATRLAALLRDEGADVLTIYDPNGGYGHPDHIQVHRVGTRAAELAGMERVLWSTMNRTRVQAMIAESEQLRESLDDETVDDAQAETFGMDEDDLTHAIDVSAVVELKRQAMRAHASQISDADFFMTLPDEVFTEVFGTEWYVDPSRPRNGAALADDLFA